jgi:hypothetical protein
MKKAPSFKKRPTKRIERPLSKEAVVRHPAYKIVGLFRSGMGTLSEQHHYYLYGLKD